MKTFKKYFRQDKGGAISEYSIVLSLIAIFVLGAIALGGENFVEKLDGLSNYL